MTIHRALVILLIAVAWSLPVALPRGQVAAQHPPEGTRCKPIAERAGELGCWIIIDQSLGRLGKSEMFWPLDTYPTRADAERAKGARGAVVESLGKVWLLSIKDKGWRPTGGERIGEIGPLPISATEAYSAQYMEAIFTPGMTAPPHIH